MKSTLKLITSSIIIACTSLCSSFAHTGGDLPSMEESQNIAYHLGMALGFVTTSLDDGISHSTIYHSNECIGVTFDDTEIIELNKLVNLLEFHHCVKNKPCDGNEFKCLSDGTYFDGLSKNCNLIMSQTSGIDHAKDLLERETNDEIRQIFEETRRIVHDSYIRLKSSSTLSMLDNELCLREQKEYPEWNTTCN